MSRRSVIQISAYYPPHLGGQEVIVQQLASRLAEAGEEVEVLTSALGAESGTTLEDEVRVHRLRSTEIGHAAIIWGLLWWLLRRTRRDTVVHLHVGQAFTPEVVWLASKVRRFKYVMQMHIDPAPSGAMGKLLPLYKKFVLARAVRGAATVIVLNETHRRIIQSDNGYSGHLVVMSNGVEDDFFTMARRPAAAAAAGVELLFVGRLSPQKNLPALLQAVGKIGGDVALDIVGDGEGRAELEEMIKARGLTNVRIHGELSRDAVRVLYSSRSALVLPSLYEAQPLVLLEAMASRIPVIATDVVGVGSIAKGVAILVEPTWQGIASGIDEFAQMPSDARNAMVERAFGRVQAFKWANLLGMYQALYKES
jgi:glycosyltransferase involved in cell wall biosynthesis